MKSFSEVFEDKTKNGYKIKTDEYKAQGKYIIVDQGQERIAGYTDLEEGLFCDVPAIVFGDHTRVIKYIDEPFFLGADGTKILKSTLPNANHKYLYYALKNARIPNTGYNRHFKWLKEVKIAYPSAEEQQNIVETLDRLTSIINKRTQELQSFDDIIKARFVEMFGTVNSNTFTYDVGTLESVSLELFAGGDKPSDCFKFKDNAHPYPVYANGFENEGLQGYSAKCRVQKSAVTISARGTIGYCFIRNAGFTPVVRLITIVPTDDLSVVYLKYAIDTMDFKSSGTSQAQLTVPDFKKERIIIPPIEEQKRFESFVKEVDKSKFVVQKALDEAQLLFDSLMQEYFG